MNPYETSRENTYLSNSPNYFRSNIWNKQEPRLISLLLVDKGLEAMIHLGDKGLILNIRGDCRSTTYIITCTKDFVYFKNKTHRYRRKIKNGHVMFKGMVIEVIK